MYAYNLLREPLVNNLCKLFVSTIEESATKVPKWQEVEAVLFALTSIAENVDLGEENTCLQSLFKMLGGVPLLHTKLISQALCVIGEQLPPFTAFTGLASIPHC